MSLTSGNINTNPGNHWILEMCSPEKAEECPKVYRRIRQTSALMPAPLFWLHRADDGHSSARSIWRVLCKEPCGHCTFSQHSCIINTFTILILQMRTGDSKLWAKSGGCLFWEILPLGVQPRPLSDRQCASRSPPKRKTGGSESEEM